KLGPYEIVAPFGAGGMGEVYRAMSESRGPEKIRVSPRSTAILAFGGSSIRSRRAAGSVSASSSLRAIRMVDAPEALHHERRPHDEAGPADQQRQGLGRVSGDRQHGDDASRRHEGSGAPAGRERSDQNRARRGRLHVRRRQSPAGNDLRSVRT